MNVEDSDWKVWALYGFVFMVGLFIIFRIVSRHQAEKNRHWSGREKVSEFDLKINELSYFSSSDDHTLSKKW